MKCKIFIILIIFVFSGLAGAELNDAEKKELFEKANESFSRGNSILDDEQSREQAYENAILGYETIIKEGKVSNPKLYYNLANAYFLKGELGKAIVNYRRAERLDDWDTNISKNLAYARSRRVDKFQTPTEKKVLETLFFWHYDFAQRSRFLAGLISFVCFCVCVSVLIMKGRKCRLLVPAVILFILGLGFGISVLVESQSAARSEYGVITAEEVIARQGDGENYPESFKGGLHEGTEFEVVEKRGNWIHILLPDGSDSWVQSSAVELI